MVEKTAEQVLVTSGVDGQLAKALPRRWERKVRDMRRDPTIGIVRDLYQAPIFAADWTVTADNPRYEDAVEMINRTVMPFRDHILAHTIRGLLDFGWQAFEKVYGFSEEGWVKLIKLKPLLQDITTILVDLRGDIKGVRNLPTYLSSVNSINNGPWVDLTRDECVVISRDVEGTNWYGEPLSRRAENPYDSWNACERSAQRYDNKIAGAQWVVYYPIGRTMYNGAMTDNFVIAMAILDAIESSGKMAIPRKALDQVEDLNAIGDDQMAWKIDMISSSSSSESIFVGRQKYQDALKARAYGIPERAVFEGQFGTKAEAEAHADFAITNIEQAHSNILAQINSEIVDPLLKLNKGERYATHVKLKAIGLSNDKRAYLRELYTSYFGSEAGQAEMQAIDWDSTREVLGLPSHRDVNDLKMPDGSTAPADNPNRPPSTRSEFKQLSRRQLQNNIKAVKDMRREVLSGETTRDMAIEVLQSIGIDYDRAERLLSDVRAPDAVREQ